MSTRKKILVALLIVVIIGSLIHLTSFEIGRAVKKAERLAENGEYATAWRLLTDTLRKEYLLWPLDRMGFYDGGQVAQALDRLEWALLHEERSALMQTFRDPERSILGKRRMVSEMLDAMETGMPDRSPFLQQHDDPFVRVLTSTIMTIDEKRELFVRMRALVEKHYIASLQKDELLEQIHHFEAVVREHLRLGNYDEAFRSLHDMEDIADLFPYTEHEMLPLVQETVDVYLHENTAPLTQLLRSAEVSFLDKRQIVAKLQKLLYTPDAFQEITIRGQRYTGSFIKLIPQFDYATRCLIWGRLESFVTRDDVYEKDDITMSLARSAFPDPQYIPRFPTGISFHQLDIKYRIDYVVVALQGTVPQKSLQEFYASLGFRSDMFSSHLSGNKAILSEYWKMPLHNVQFAHLTIEEPEGITWKGRFIFAYQPEEFGNVSFFLFYTS